jgi:hypothetical protein
MIFTYLAALPIFSGIGFTVLIIGFERLLGWERLPSFGRFGYVKMMKFLMINILLPCRSFTGTLRLRSSLQQVENHILFIEVCAWLEDMTRDTFFQHE